MRNSATHQGKDLAKEIALLRSQLEDLAETVNGTGNSLSSAAGRCSRIRCARRAS